MRRLRPITFDWQQGGIRDIGFAAEEVNEIEPLLITYKDGQVEGVKYAQITTVLVNAVKAQQAQLESQQNQLGIQQKQVEAQAAQIKRQQALIENLRAILCSQNPQAEICKEQQK